MKFHRFLFIVCALVLVLCSCGINTPPGDTGTAGTDDAALSETAADSAEPPLDISALPDISDRWNKAEYPALIAHAGGSIYGYRLTNSLEALNNAYSNGFRLIELDFQITSDGEYVLLHDWESMAWRMLFEEGQLSRDQFLEAEKFADLTLLDLDMLVSWLASHPDCRIITDAKCENLPFLQRLSQLPEAAKEQFVPQAYSYEEYLSAAELGFDDIILTLYAMNSPRNEIVRFIYEQKPFAVTIPETVLTEELIGDIASLGAVVYTHTVNDLSTYEKWKNFGLHGIYTDHFYPSKWVY